VSWVEIKPASKGRNDPAKVAATDEKSQWGSFEKYYQYING
jgi:hypothetical protein